MLERPKPLSLKTFSFPEWYKDFKKISIRSHIVNIPPKVLEYLKDEMIVLPKECNETTHENELGDDYLDEDTEETVPPEFPDFSKALQEKLRILNGSAFIKTNFHCPKDSVWITAGQTMRARSLSDVYMLLKASSICKEDLACENVGEQGHVVVLRQWTEIHPGTEFRCFVKNKCLIAISPRDWPQYHAHIAQHKRDIINDIVSLFKEKIKEKFPIDDYVFDVFRETKDEVYLVDFSPFDESVTQALAFEWPELHSSLGVAISTPEDEDDPEFRYLPEDCGIQPNPRNNYGIPHDVINLFKAQQGTATSTEESEMDASTVNDLLINRLREECESQSRDDE
ncbi:translation initiation factor eIF2 assembly protein-like [Culicoides brevitarsis]|uniref:translation initiation factor eIF2 assembly protein-like n=1 Tax=Culicoides brevitarsis TaxID=469753 RepID=UPI00307B4470